MPAPVSRAETARIRALLQRKKRAETGRFLAEGLRVVEDLLAAGIVPELALAAPSLEDTARGRELLASLSARAPLRSATEAQLRQLAGTESPQGVLVVAPVPPATPPELAAGKAALVLALDGIQDPGNFGTLVRSAEAFGAAAVVCLPGTVDPWNPKSVRAAAGASFRVPILPLAPEALGVWARRAELQLWGAAADGTDVRALALPDRVVLIVGNEGAGLGEAITALLDARVALRIRGGAESLNAAMAGTVLLYLLTSGSDIA